MLNINMTGGLPKVIISWTVVGGTAINVTQMVDPGLEGQIKMVDATDWEGGAGRRCCDSWRDLGTYCPRKVEHGQERFVLQSVLGILEDR